MNAPLLTEYLKPFCSTLCIVGFRQTVLLQITHGLLPGTRSSRKIIESRGYLPRKGVGGGRGVMTTSYFQMGNNMYVSQMTAIQCWVKNKYHNRPEKRTRDK